MYTHTCRHLHLHVHTHTHTETLTSRLLHVHNIYLYAFLFTYSKCSRESVYHLHGIIVVRAAHYSVKIGCRKALMLCRGVVATG